MRPRRRKTVPIPGPTTSAYVSLSPWEMTPRQGSLRLWRVGRNSQRSRRHVIGTETATSGAKKKPSNRASSVGSISPCTYVPHDTKLESMSPALHTEVGTMTKVSTAQNP